MTPPKLNARKTKQAYKDLLSQRQVSMMQPGLVLV